MLAMGKNEAPQFWHEGVDPKTPRECLPTDNDPSGLDSTSFIVEHGRIVVSEMAIFEKELEHISRVYGEPKKSQSFTPKMAPTSSRVWPGKPIRLFHT